MKICILLLVLIPVCCFSQKDSSSKFTVGVEQDILPYATGGYFIGFWMGKDQVRVRTLFARVNKPDFIIKKGFTNNKVSAYAITADYFLKKNWTGWWAGAGLVYWKSSIQSDAKLSTVYYNSTLINGSIGYNFMLYKHFYLSPWVGMHVKVSGIKNITVDAKDFSPPLLNAEGSIKLGWYF